MSPLQQPILSVGDPRKDRDDQSLESLALRIKLVSRSRVSVTK